MELFLLVPSPPIRFKKFRRTSSITLYALWVDLPESRFVSPGN